uniref:Tyrosine-protein phosphatase domain-containing protein n=1 Tax=Gongylonema pulchrum TaxID=637853 RepID=A0A183EU53_9BILA
LLNSQQQSGDVSLGFMLLPANNREIQLIAQYGVCVNNNFVGDLGDPAHGVYLSQYPDLVTAAPFLDLKTKVLILVCKVSLLFSVLVLIKIVITCQFLCTVCVVLLASLLASLLPLYFLVGLKIPLITCPAPVLLSANQTAHCTWSFFAYIHSLRPIHIHFLPVHIVLFYKAFSSLCICKSLGTRAKGEKLPYKIQKTPEKVLLLVRIVSVLAAKQCSTGQKSKRTASYIADEPNLLLVYSDCEKLL